MDRYINLLLEDDVVREREYAWSRMAKAFGARLYHQMEIGHKELNQRGVRSSFGCYDASHKA